MKYRTLTQSAISPCTVDFVKSQLRLTHDVHDAYLESLISAATDWACGYTGRQINQANLLAYSGYFGVKLFEIERGPVIAISKVEYLNNSGILVEIPALKYSVLKDELSAIIYLNDDFEFVDINLKRDGAIQVTYIGGFGGSVTGSIPFPEVVKNAIALKAAAFYTNPSDGVDEKVSVSENLLKTYRCPIV